MSALLATVLSAVIVLLLSVAVFRDRGSRAAQGAAIALAASALLFAIRLPLPALAALGVAVIGFAHAARAGGSRPGRRPEAGSPRSRRSTVRTAVLEMSFDPGSGRISGRVLQGPHAGSALDHLTVAQLLEVAGAIDERDAKSLSLLSTYLDRVHPGWSDGPGEDAQGPPPPVDAGSMTRDDAYRVLGLKPGASREEVAEAHRRLIKRVHPDAGGSAVLAAHINAAKARLL